MNLKKRFLAILYRTLILLPLILPQITMAQLCDIVYVSAAIGNDANTGTAALPVATLNQALTMVGGSRTTIWMSGGSYTQNSIVNVTNGLTVEGGFAVAGSTWTKSTAQTTTITFSGIETVSGVRHMMAFKADGVSNWQLKDLSIITTNVSGTDPSNRGSSNYAVWVNNCTNYTISRCNITVGNASAGANGSVGANGANGNNGSQGGSGSCDGNYTCCFGSESAPGGNGGAGGQGAIGIAAGAANSSTTNNNPGTAGTGRNGGGGGAGGKGGGFSGGNNAVAGSAGGGSSSTGTNNGVGSAGAEGTTGGDGNNGANGIAGNNGTIGSNGPAGTNIGSFFVPGGQAGTGTDGIGGQGGAGGGGGGRQNGAFVNAGPGNGGAGGGGGGQGALGGTGGFGGGAVFGIYTTSSTVGADIVQNTIVLGSAGSGGIGGAGGVGGAGGTGGPRNTTCTAEIGEGGAGGNGGSGGNGGQGGTGAAGIAAQLSVNGVSSSPSVTIPVVPVISSLHLGCTNSEITLTKASGTWTLPAGMNFIEDLNSGSSSYNTTSATAIVGVSNIGNYSPQVNGTAYQNYTGAFVSRALPAFAVSTPTIVCEGDVFPMSTPTSGTQFEWVIIPTSGSTAAPTAIFTTSVASWPTPITGTTGSYRVRLRVFTNCCGWSVPVYHNFSVVATSVGPIATGATICAGQTATLIANGSGLGNLSWYADPLGQIVLQTTVGASTTFTTPSLNQSAVYYIGETVSGCLTTLTAVQATVAPTPNAPAGSSAPVCEGAPITLNGFGTGGTLSWFNVASGGTAIGTGANFNAGVLAAGSYTYYVSESNGSCNSPRTAVGALVNTAPAAPTATSTTICSGNSTTLTATGSGTVQWYADAAMTTQLGTGAIFNTPVLTGNTTYHVAQLNSAGCRSTSATPVTVTVTALPLAPVGTGTTICAGNPATLSATGGSGTLTWFSDPSGSVQVGTGTSFTTPVLNQTTAFYVRETASSCQSPLTQVTATVNTLPIAPAASAAAVCAGASVILNGFGSGGTLSWFNVANGGTALGSGSNFNAGALAAGTYTFYVSENNGTCTSSRTPVAVTVNAAPSAPTASGATTCSGTPASLSATGSGAIQWYSDVALTNLLSTGSTFNTPVLTANTTYQVVASSAAGCLSTATPVTVNVTALPAAPLGTGATICAGNSASLTASGGSGSLSWFADPSGTISVGTGSSYTTPVLNQTTAYYVRETASGCQSPLTQVTATVNALPSAPAGTAAAVCAGSSVILNGFGSGGTLSWFNVANGGTALGSGSNFNAGVLSAGTYTFYVSENNGTCSSARTPVAVQVNATPAAPNTSGTTICSGAFASLSATGSGALQWYSDVALTNLLSTGSTFNTPALTTNTTYQVVASSAAGCLSTATPVTVNVTALPAAPVGTGASVCAGNTATLTAVAGSGTLTWFADPFGTTSVGTGASFTTPVLNQTTAYYVRETALGCQSSLTQVTATVNTLPSAPAGSAAAVCAGSSVILNGFGSGGTLSWFNVSNGGTALGSGTNFNAGVLAAGSYTFYVEENNGNCSSVRTPVAVVVNAAPVAPTAQNDGPACQGNDVFLQASNVAGASYSWSGPNGFSSNLQTIMILSSTAADAGVYTVSAIVNGCASAASSTTVTVNPLPQISGTISNNGPLCEGEELTLTAPVVAGVSYEWTGPNGFSSNQSTATISNVNEFDQQGFYTLIVTDANGCSSLPLSTLVEITSLPQAGMAISNGPLCTGSTLNLSVAEVFGASYSWSGPNGFTSTDRTPSIQTVSAADAGLYTVTVSRNNCQTELDVNVVIDTIPNVTVIADTTIQSSDELMLYAAGGIIYQWSPATYLSSPFSPTTIFAGAPAGTYTLTVFIQDAKGCSAEEQVNITVEASDEIVVTDLFTPNGDGVNETWVIEFLDNVGPYTLQVFTRGGLEVLNSQNYTNDWDGTHYKSGKKLPDGTYYYIIRTDNNEYTGAVTIKR